MESIDDTRRLVGLGRWSVGIIILISLVTMVQTVWAASDAQGHLATGQTNHRQPVLAAQQVTDTPTVTLTPTPTPTATGTPPTATPTFTVGPTITPLPSSTLTPLPTDTTTVVAPTATPLPPQITVFKVEQSPITAGDSATLYWQVIDAADVLLRGPAGDIPIGPVGNLVVQPATEHKLYPGGRNPSGEVTAFIDIVVNPALPTTAAITNTIYTPVATPVTIFTSTTDLPGTDLPSTTLTSTTFPSTTLTDSGLTTTVTTTTELEAVPPYTTTVPMPTPPLSPLTVSIPSATTQIDPIGTRPLLTGMRATHRVGSDHAGDHATPYAGRTHRCHGRPKPVTCALWWGSHCGGHAPDLAFSGGDLLDAAYQPLRQSDGKALAIPNLLWYSGPHEKRPAQRIHQPQITIPVQTDRRLAAGLPEPLYGAFCRGTALYLSGGAGRTGASPSFPALCLCHASHGGAAGNNGRHGASHHIYPTVSPSRQPYQPGRPISTS